MTLRALRLAGAALLLFSTVARADSQQLAPVKLDVTQLDHAIKNARIRRNVGIGMALPGLASAILGTILLTYGIKKVDVNTGTEITEDVSGGVTAIIGLALAIPGVALWIMGQDTMDTLKWRREQVVTPFVSGVSRGDGNGAVIGVKITF